MIELNTSKRQIIESKLKEYLKKGCSVLIGYGTDHIVRLQNIVEEGLIVDDPYGKIVDYCAEGCTKKYKKNGTDYRNSIDSINITGNNCIWSWSDIEKCLLITVVEIYCKK